MEQMHQLARAASGLWGTQKKGECGKSFTDFVFYKKNAECREPAIAAVRLPLPLM